MIDDIEFAEDEIISDLIQILNQEVKTISRNQDVNVNIKIAKLNIIIDTMRYLDRYKENRKEVN